LLQDKLTLAQDRKWTSTRWTSKGNYYTR